MGVVTHVSSLLKIFSPSFRLLWLVQSVFSVASVCECHKIMISPHYSFCCTICECHKIIVGPQCLLCSISLCISFMFESLLWLRCLILINLEVYSAAIYKMLSKWCSPVFWLREHETVASATLHWHHYYHCLSLLFLIKYPHCRIIITFYYYSFHLICNLEL